MYPNTACAAWNPAAYESSRSRLAGKEIMRLGEPASETAWPAIANAIYDAVGICLGRLAFTPSQIPAALQPHHDP